MQVSSQARTNYTWDSVTIKGHSHKTVIPLKQKPIFNYLPTVSISEITDGWASDSLNKTSSMNIPVKIKDVRTLQHIQFKFGITQATAAKVINPTHAWFDRIEIKSAGSNNVVNIYSEAIMYKCFAPYTDSSATAIARRHNYNTNPASLFGLAPAQPVGSRPYDLDVPISLFQNLPVDFLEAKSDLNFIFYPRGFITADATTNTTTLASVTVVIKNHDLDPDHTRGLVDGKVVDLTKVPRSVDYLNWQIVEENNYAVAAGQNFIDLKSLSGKCAFMLLMIRATTWESASNCGMLQFVNLGELNYTSNSLATLAGIDIVNSRNESFLGNGSLVPAVDLRWDESVHDGPSSLIQRKAIYPISFMGSSTMNAFNGQKDGYLQFDSNNNLRLRLYAVATVSEVQTFTASAGATAGTYRFSYKGQLSDPLAFNASVGVMKTAFEAIPAVSVNNITVTFSATAAAGAAFTGTFGVPEEGLTELVQIIGQNTFDVSHTTTLTTKGAPGVTVGNYDIRILAAMYNRITYIGGKLTEPIEI